MIDWISSVGYVEVINIPNGEAAREFATCGGDVYVRTDSSVYRIMDYSTIDGTKKLNLVEVSELVDFASKDTPAPDQ